MFGISPDEEDKVERELRGDETREEPERRSLSRPPSMVDLRKDTDSVVSGTSQSSQDRRKSSLGLGQFSSDKPGKDQRDVLTPAELEERLSDVITDSESVGSVEGVYDLLKEDSPPMEQLSPQTFRSRALSVPMLLPQPAFVDDESESDDQKEGEEEGETTPKEEAAEDQPQEALGFPPPPPPQDVAGLPPQEVAGFPPQEVAGLPQVPEIPEVQFEPAPEDVDDVTTKL